uniref:Ubiquitin-conjugating enzyme E2 2 n=1 Tax=Ganoderma boninense TaxID=34458 RepID=A0A5K1K4I7_9APHY|nr:Ubiquitin-conjugating enzyme E2 2 [Ganoderma boninense]
MDNLAIELVEKIAAFASTDGGRTATSLSLTSKYIREATRATRFHSVSLTKNSKKQLAQFLAHLRAERAALADRTTPRIRHLCIAPAEGAADICRMAAPDLYTLALIQGSDAPEIDPEVILVNGVDFPLLEELTIFGVGAEFGAVTASPKLPRLRRLHILPVSSKELPLVSAPDLRLWSQRAPGVTHLRVAFTDDKNAVLKAQIENIAAPELLGLPVMFPKLEEVLVQLTHIESLKRKGSRPRGLIRTTFGPSPMKTRPLTFLPGKTTTIGELDAEVEREWWAGSAWERAPTKRATQGGKRDGVEIASEHW